MPPVRVVILSVLCVVLEGACSTGSATPSAGDSVTAIVSPAGPRITAEPTEPTDTAIPADTPNPDEAYQQLLAAIPQPIASGCHQVAGGSRGLEPGEFARADCTPPAGALALASSVSYRLFDSSSSMNAWFDTQAAAISAAGRARTPGCGQGTGRDVWLNGRVQCYRSASGGAEIQWTHDLLYVDAVASRSDSNFTKLQQFWPTAGPVAP
jgi:hypothetical protein